MNLRSSTIQDLYILPTEGTGEASPSLFMLLQDSDFCCNSLTSECHKKSWENGHFNVHVGQTTCENSLEAGTCEHSARVGIVCCT